MCHALHHLKLFDVQARADNTEKFPLFSLKIFTSRRNYEQLLNCWIISAQDLLALIFTFSSIFNMLMFFEKWYKLQIKLIANSFLFKSEISSHELRNNNVYNSPLPPERELDVVFLQFHTYSWIQYSDGIVCDAPANSCCWQQLRTRHSCGSKYRNSEERICLFAVVLPKQSST